MGAERDVLREVDRLGAENLRLAGKADDLARVLEEAREARDRYRAVRAKIARVLATAHGFPTSDAEIDAFCADYVPTAEERRMFERATERLRKNEEDATRSDRKARGLCGNCGGRPRNPEDPDEFLCPSPDFSPKRGGKP